MLDPAFGLNLRDANAISEKIEGLAWGPDLPDGQHVLYVFSDNDLNRNLDTQVFAFAIDPALIDFVPQFQFLPGTREGGCRAEQRVGAGAGRPTWLVKVGAGMRA